jgi:CBS domain-containing protein
MSIKVEDLMSSNVVTGKPHLTVAQLKDKMAEKNLKTLPIVGPEQELLGVVSLNDLLAAEKDGSPVTNHMTQKVYTIPQYESVEIAARMMRNHKIHHLIVTRDKALVGILSSYDLLALVEGKRFVMKNPSTPRNKSRGKRAKAEL